MLTAKVPQHLELDDVIAWGLGASDLLFVVGGAILGWWLYIALPAEIALRIAAAATSVLVGALLGLGRVGDRSMRVWLRTIIAFAARPRLLLVGGRR